VLKKNESDYYHKLLIVVSLFAVASVRQIVKKRRNLIDVHRFYSSYKTCQSCFQKRRPDVDYYNMCMRRTSGKMF